MQSTSPEVTLEAAAHRIQTEPSATQAALQTAFPILAMLSVCHFLNDMIQSLLPAIYPLLKDSFRSEEHTSDWSSDVCSSDLNVPSTR